ncbi:hypothetical protein [Novosphingobium sp. 9]|uniref:hypothetical protein n=1 Tax=Novosphingobium sp. 9 TaxID=2025349 RepID=UPI0021B6A28A|nr:hypothetical protein [Novosphingobium sp. 9]
MRLIPPFPKGQLPGVEGLVCTGNQAAFAACLKEMDAYQATSMNDKSSVDFQPAKCALDAIALMIERLCSGLRPTVGGPIGSSPFRTLNSTPVRSPQSQSYPKI